MDSKRWASTIVDEALIAAMMPWACPCDFGPEGRFRLEELVSLGRRSLVYKGTDKKLSSEGFAAAVAIKISSFAHAGVVDALSARRVVHPNVVRVLDFGIDTESGAEYVVTEFIDGGDLSGQTVPCEPRKAARLVAQIARGVQAAHSAGVVHCDLKPANILITSDGTPKLTDFDLCHSPVNTDKAARGNSAFMSPEQMQGGEIGLNPLSDVYALGGLLRWLLTGSVEFPRDGSRDLELESKAPPDLVSICRKALSPGREWRHLSAEALAEDLECWLTYRPIAWTKPPAWKRAKLWTRRNPAMASISVAAITVVILGSVMWQRSVAFEQREHEAAQAKALKLAQDELARLKASGGAKLKAIIQATGVLPTQPADRLFAQLVIWSSLSKSDLVGNDVKAEYGLERIGLLKSFIDDRTGHGRGETLQTIYARFALAELLIASDQSELARPHLEPVSVWIKEHCKPTDPFCSAVNLLNAAAEFDLSEPGSGRSPERLASLRDALAMADRAGDCDEAADVARQVLSRHGVRE